MYHKVNEQFYNKLNSLFLKLKKLKSYATGHFLTLLRHVKGVSYQNQILPKFFFHTNEPNGGVGH